MKYLLSAMLILSCASVHAQTLRVFNWENYIDPNVLRQFERDTGVSVDYQTYSTAQELYDALEVGNDFDLIVPSHFQLQRLIDNDYLQVLDSSKLANYKNLDLKIIGSLAGFSDAKNYVVPYLWNSVGLAVDSLEIERALGERVEPSWLLLFDPQYVSRLQGCGIGWLDAPEEVFSLWLNAKGKRLHDSSPKRLADVGQQLKREVPVVRALDNEAYIDKLAAGQLCIAMAWSGHALKASSQNTALEFVVPEEGGVLTIDSLAIPKGAKNPELAYQFIDYMLDPHIARLNVEATRFYSSLDYELPEMAELAQHSPTLVPQSTERHHLYFLEVLRPEQSKMVDQQWATIRQQFLESH